MCALNKWTLTVIGVSSRPGQGVCLAGVTFFLPSLFSRSVSSELLLIYISLPFLFLFSPPSLAPAYSNPHLRVLCRCLLPVALRRALSLMYLRPPQAAVFTRPLQGGNRRRMTWSMFPVEGSTAFSLLQLSQPFFIMSSLCSSCYR